MANRYSSRSFIRNDDKKYSKKFKGKAKKFILQYGTPKLKHPTNNQVAKLETVDYVWKTGDSFTSIAHEMYGDIDFWWVIAWFNQTPSKFMIEDGETIGIPFPLDRVLTYMEV